MKPKQVANFVSTGEGGRMVGRSSQTIRSYIHRGLLTGYRVGPRNFKVDPEELVEVVSILDGYWE